MKRSIINVRSETQTLIRKRLPFDRNYFPLMRIGNYYDLNSHKNPILDFVQQMVSEKRGDTLRQTRCDGGECRQEY